MKITKKKVIIISITLVAFIIIFAILFMPKKKQTTTPSVPLAITSTVPAKDSSEVSVFDPITIMFNQDVDPASVTVTSDPAENWTTTQLSPNTIRADHKLYLKVATTYHLTIFLHGSPFDTLLFQTASDQNDPRQIQNLQSEVKKDYPLAQFTPYKNINYRVVYSAPLTLEIDISGSIDPQQAISQVQTWVSTHGVNPSTHKYVVVSPSPTP